MNLLPGRIKRSWCHPASKQLLSSLWIRSFSTSYPTPITLRLRQPLLRPCPFAAAPQRPIHKGCKHRTFHHRRLALASISYATISYHRIYGIYLSTIFLFCQEYFKIFFKFFVQLSMMGDTFIKKIKILLQLCLVKVEQWRFSQKCCIFTN